jgi:hypothetical protein
VLKLARKISEELMLHRHNKILQILTLKADGDRVNLGEQECCNLCGVL